MRVYLNTDVIILMMYHNRISAREIARQEGMNVIHLGQILRHGMCNYNTAAKIAKALGLPVEQIILPILDRMGGYQKNQWAQIDPLKVVQIMEQKKISADALAIRYGCTRQNIWYLLNPKRGLVRLKSVETLARALDVNVEEIIKEAVQDE